MWNRRRRLGRGGSSQRITGRAGQSGALRRGLEGLRCPCPPGHSSPAHPVGLSLGHASGCSEPFFLLSLCGGLADCPVASHFFWLICPSPSLPHLCGKAPKKSILELGLLGGSFHFAPAELGFLYTNGFTLEGSLLCLTSPKARLAVGV